MLKTRLIISLLLGVMALQAQPYTRLGSTLTDFTSFPTLQAKELPINIFPNPMNEVLTVHLNILEAEDQNHIQILGISGEPVVQLPLEDRQTQLDLSHLPRGWYTVNLVLGKQRISKRVFKMAGP